MSIRVLEDGGRTAGRLGLIEVTLPPHGAGPPQHLHREHDETFYVLSGNPTFVSGRQELRAGPGTLVTASTGTPHTFANPGPEPALMLCTVTPEHYIGYFRELEALGLSRSGGFDPAVVAGVMARYATELAN